MHVDDRLLLLEGNVGQLAAVRRPGRGNDRFGRGQRRRGVLAIGIGDLQQELTAGFDDIGDARREDTLLAGQLFVDVIGDAMAGGAQLGIAGDVSGTAQGHAFLRIVEAETGFHAAIGTAPDTARRHRVGTACLPVAVIDRRIFIESQAPVIDQLEQAATLQITAHRGGDDAGSGRIARKIDDGDRNAIGTGAGDLDGQLGLGKAGAEQRNGEESAAGKSGHCVHFQKFRAILLFKRAVFDFQRPLEQRGIVRLGQR